MKPNKLTVTSPSLKITCATLLLAVASFASVTAQETVRYEPVPKASTCTMDGTSTLHDWTMTSSTITGYIEADANFPYSALTNSAAASPKVVANFPARTFLSGKAAMDENMQKAVNADKFWKMEYRLISLKPISKPGATGPLEFEALGTLTIAGTTNTNTMPIKIEKQNDKLKVAGSTSLKMTTYKVTPPVVSVLGVSLTTGDDLKIKFDWVLAPKKKAP